MTDGAAAQRGLPKRDADRPRGARPATGPDRQRDRYCGDRTQETRASTQLRSTRPRRPARRARVPLPQRPASRNPSTSDVWPVWSSRISLGITPPSQKAVVRATCYARRTIALRALNKSRRVPLPFGVRRGQSPFEEMQARARPGRAPAFDNIPVRRHQLGRLSPRQRRQGRSAAFGGVVRQP